MNSTATNTPHEWNGINLEDLRQIMDPPADEAVMSVYDSGHMDHLRVLLTGLASNDSPLPEELPQRMKDFVSGELNRQFSAEDIEMFQQTHEIWRKHGTNFIFVLFFRALPYTYMAERPANVLTMSQLLVKEPARRVIETAQFVFDVMDKNWWEPGKRGILTALKVRIMHASMRHILLNNKTGAEWNNAWGKPISQEDLIATNQTFSLEFFKGLEMMGKPLTEQEQKAWFHTWKTIGSIMGVQDQLLCKTIDQAWDLQHSIYAHLFISPEHTSGTMLAKALVDTMSKFHLSEKISLLLMRKMLSDDRFPDCFNDMLGPDFKAAHPELFHVPAEADRDKHEAMLRQTFHTHLKEMHAKAKEASKDMKVEVHMEVEKNFFEQLLDMLKNLFSSEKAGTPKQHMIHLHLGKVNDVIQNNDPDTPMQKMEETIIEDSTSAIGGVIVGVLTVFFRPGKNSGFRVPKDLQELWSSEGIK